MWSLKLSWCICWANKKMQLLFPSLLPYMYHIYIHFTLMVYAPEQICLPHCTYMYHCTATVVYIKTPHKSHITYKTGTYMFYLPWYIHLCSSSSIPIKYHKCKLYDVHWWGKYAKIYATWKVAVIKNVVCKMGYREKGRHKWIVFNCKGDLPNQLKSH